jgi:hypothetical protein
MDKIMTHKNISKKNLTFKNDFYETIVDIYNEGGCESVREYIDNNNDIDSKTYAFALKEMLDDDNTDELFELIITHEKSKHTEIIDEFIQSCNIRNNLLYCDKNKFKFNLIWKIKEPNFYKMEVELKQYQEEMKSELHELTKLDPLTLFLTLDPYYPPDELTLSHFKLHELDPYYPILSERGREISRIGMKTEQNLRNYIEIGSYFGYTNGTIKLLEYQSIFFEFWMNFSELFCDFKEHEYGILNYILNNENTKEVVIEYFIDFVNCFTRKKSLSVNMREETFKKVLDLISKNLSEEQFQFLLEYLMRELVYAYGVKETEYHYNIIELVKYIHDLYGDKIKISFNIDYDYSYHKEINEFNRYKDQIYDQMILNGYEFLSTFASIFYEDLFFPKKDLINHIVDKNNFYRLKIKEDNLNKNDFTFFIKYQRTLSELVSNINTIKKEIESEQLKYLQDLIADIDVIYDELVDKYSERMI